MEPLFDIFGSMNIRSENTNENLLKGKSLLTPQRTVGVKSNILQSSKTAKRALTDVRNTVGQKNFTETKPQLKHLALKDAKLNEIKPVDVGTKKSFTKINNGSKLAERKTLSEAEKLRELKFLFQNEQKIKQAELQKLKDLEEELQKYKLLEEDFEAVDPYYMPTRTENVDDIEPPEWKLDAKVVAQNLTGIYVDSTPSSPLSFEIQEIVENDWIEHFLNDTPEVMLDFEEIPEVPLPDF